MQRSISVRRLPINRLFQQGFIIKVTLLNNYYLNISNEFPIPISSSLRSRVDLIIVFRAISIRLFYIS